MKIIKFLFPVLLLSVLCNAQSWKQVGAGCTGGNGIYALFNDTANNLLYTGGDFLNAGGNSAKYLAKWNGVNWESVSSTTPIGVGSMAVLNNEIFIGNYTTNSVKKWNGSSWSSLPTFSNGINTLAIVNGELYAGSMFNQSTNPINGIARWTGTAWDSVGTGLGDFMLGTPCIVNDIVEYQGKLVAAGQFPRAGSDTVYNIAIWDGTSWSRLGSGMLNGLDADNEDVYDLYADGNNLYAAGRFVKAGGVTVNGIAKWDGVSWHNLGIGSTTAAIPFVEYVAIYQNKLIAKGDFIYPFESALSYWNGFQWKDYNDHEIVGGTGTNCMTVFKNELYIGSSFQTDTNGQVLNCIARRAVVDLEADSATCFNSCNAQASAPEIGIEPNTYEWSNGETTQTITGLCAGNYSVTVTDSTGSSSLGTITISSPPELLITDTSINASCQNCSDGAATTTVTGGITPYTYLWSNGETTNSIDSLLHGDYTVTVTAGNGCATVDTVTVGFDVGVNGLQISDLGFKIYPNPASEQLIIDIGELEIQNMQITDMTGRIILSTKPLTRNSKTIIDMNSCARGMYFIKCFDGKQPSIIKVVKE